MRFIDLRQNTPAWYAWRKSGLGASDATVIMEAPVPWKDPVTLRQLWEEKTGRSERPESNYPQRRGQRLEPTVRELYRQKTGLDAPACCVEHDTLSWLRASLDGLDEWGELILEIKCPRIETHEEALAGRISAYYLDQLDHQLAVTGAKLLHFVSYSEKKGLAEKDRLAVVEYRPDPERIRRLLVKEWAFWGYVQLGFWPQTETAAAS